MTFSGKKLQDVYDAGAARLTELETTFIDNLKKQQKEHASDLKVRAESCTEQLEQKAQNLKAKLSNRADESLQKISQVIESEKNKIRDHSTQLVSELTSLSGQLKATITALEHTSVHKANYLNLSALDQFMIAFEEARLTLTKENNSGLRELKRHGAVTEGSLQQKLEQALWEVRGDEKQVTGALFKTYMQKARVIDDHFSELIDRLSGEGNNQSQNLNQSAANSQNEVTQQANSILEKIEEQASEIENQIRKYFQDITQEHQNTLGEGLVSIADDLSKVHEITANAIASSAKELSEELLIANAQSKISLQNRCQDLKDKVENAMNDLESRLKERVKLSSDLKLSLEKERDEIIQGMQTEVVQIKDSFEKKVLDLIATSAQRVKDLSKQATKEIKDAQQKCDQTLGQEGNAVSDEMQKEVKKFLELIKNHRMVALDEITKAVGNDEETTDQSSFGDSNN